MIFSYYYDVGKQHLLNCGFNVTRLNTQSDGSQEATFTGYIEEILNGEVLKRESVQRTFLFGTGDTGRGGHNVDFLRKRFADENKWVFEIRNNNNSAQVVVIGLISDTAVRNPLGLDIIHNSELYDSEVKGSNLSQIDIETRSPFIRQTMVNADFTSLGYPYGFSSETGIQDTVLNMMQASQFEQEFLEEIPTETSFQISMNIAPETLDLKYTGDPFLELEVPNIGMLKAYGDRLTYLRHGSPIESLIQVMFPKKKEVADFYNNGFQPNSSLSIEADGRGILNLRYCGETINTTYSPSLTVSEILMRGGVKAEGEIVEEPDDSQPTLPGDLDPKSWVSHKIDNLLAYYTK